MYLSFLWRPERKFYFHWEHCFYEKHSGKKEFSEKKCYPSWMNFQKHVADWNLDCSVSKNVSISAMFLNIENLLHLFLFPLSNKSKTQPTYTSQISPFLWMSRNLRICWNPLDMSFPQEYSEMLMESAEVLALPGKTFALLSLFHFNSIPF